ncbi:MAG TPA: hypothetical protein ENN69_02810, partial [Spirochaetia bacterium]|nr:hypothetical protein [Spirochaetia bacterium]
LSHQLKSPINSIESLLRVITDGFSGETNAKTIQLIQRALTKTEEARELVNDLLNYQKYSTTAVRKEKAELVQVVTTLFNRYTAAATDKNIALSLETPPSTRIFFSGEKRGMELALGNFLDNAVKYCRPGGQVAVGINLDHDRRTAHVRISDSGPGISKEDLSRLFTPFFRSGSTRAGTSGSGLGLSIADSIIRQHEGTIAVDSTPGKGTTVTVTLPVIGVEHAPEKPRKRIVIIGGVTAGPKAAARLRRLDEDLDITIVEKSEFLSYAGCGIPAYLSGKVTSPKALMSTADATLRDVNFFEHIKNIKIRNKTLAERIDRKKKEVHVRHLETGATASLPYDILIVATGARSLVPPIPGIDNPCVHSLYNIEDAERIKEVFSHRLATDVFIIGGGLIGVETADSLMASGARVTILERDPHILKLFDPDISRKIREILSLKGIKVQTGVTVKEILHENNQARIVTDKGPFLADLIILSAGVCPNAELAKEAGLEVGPHGGVKVDDYLRTSDPSIYAIGDCAETKSLLGHNVRYLPLGSISTKMGRIAADNIAGKRNRFRGGLGTTMFRIFDTSAGRTGLGEADARREGFDPVSVIAGGLDHTHYYEGADNIVLKVIADRKSRQLLGAQGYGSGAVITRIEILASAISARMTIQD